MAVRLGELLLRENLLTSGQLLRALDHQRANSGRLGSTLVKLGFVRSDQVTAMLGHQLGVTAVNLDQCDPEDNVLQLIPAATAGKHQVIPVARSATTLTVAMVDPRNAAAVDEITLTTGLRVETAVATEMAIRDAIRRCYRQSVVASAARPGDLASRALEDLGRYESAGPQLVPTDTHEIDAAALERNGDEAPIIRLVGALLLTAIQRGASDVHIEPYEHEMRVRLRIDGVLHPVMSPPLRHRDPIISRLKIMARLDIAERRLPQDGRIKVRLKDKGEAREVDLRVSCLPTLFGETLVLRILDREQFHLDMTRLGLDPQALLRLDAAIRRPWGMVLASGPTGSGKTNTLYSAISLLNQPGINIVTAEDPVEFNLPGINQLQVREQIGLTFATALRSFLRQDPNVILVGEIRDGETAAIAVKAALTGHLVLSTVHTNDAPGTVNRLVDMGVEPFLLTSSVNLICAQRLVRRVCRHCCETRSTPAALLTQAGFEPEEAAAIPTVQGRGCERCDNTGYRGRVGLFEVMEMSDNLKQFVLDRAPLPALRRLAVAEGMTTLRRSGLNKVREGVTTLDEVIRETVADR